MDVQIHPSWKTVLKDEFNKTYFEHIVSFLKTERALNHIIYPPGSLIFNAFNHTPFQNVRVVIMGQDPYHGEGQAHGLCFSVLPGTKLPPSLQNIFKEIRQDIGVAMPSHYGDLTSWADQGILMLNSALTVRAGEPFSHAKIGWQEFTDAVIKTISNQKQDVIFLLWGKFAQEKQILIDETRHKVLKAAHPSPFSADKGFFGCKHFSRANELLMQMQQMPIDWKIEEPAY